MTVSKVNRFRRKLESHIPLPLADCDRLDQIAASQMSIPMRVDLTGHHDMVGGRLVLMEGFACQYRVLAGSRRQITAYLVPGDSYDLDAALQNPMNHPVMALTPVRVVRLPAQSIAAITRDYPAIAEGLRVADRVEAATLREWLTNIGGRPALERIAHLFCELELRLHAVGLVEEGRFDMPITQYDLADTLGLSSVHVNRTLQELRRQGLISLMGRSLTILDRPALQALADFQSSYLSLHAMA